MSIKRAIRRLKQLNRRIKAGKFDNTMTCQSCSQPHPPHELAGGLCLRCLARKAEELRKISKDAYGRLWPIGSVDRWLLFELSRAIDAIPADLSIPSDP